MFFSATSYDMIVCMNENAIGSQNQFYKAYQGANPITRQFEVDLSQRNREI